MAATDSQERESGSNFMPKFGADGLVTGVVLDVNTREVLMVAHLDQKAIDAQFTQLYQLYQKEGGQQFG